MVTMLKIYGSEYLFSNTAHQYELDSFRWLNIRPDKSTSKSPESSGFYKAYSCRKISVQPTEPFYFYLKNK